ncbi:MAG: hypothetical protein ACI35R_18735 [Bacillus sp. (in: firmicutes)]
MDEVAMYTAGGMMLAFLPLLICLILTILGIVFIVKAMKFMNKKEKLDQERNELLKELLKNRADNQENE